MKITTIDLVSYKVSSREYTDEGFLKVPGRVARTGIQDYTARELSLDGDPNRIIKVFRPADEVFKAESLNSYDHSDATNDHPSNLVNSTNFKKVTVGSVVSPGVKDGDFVKVDLIIKDEETIKLIESGKAELSAGYTAEYCDEPGTTKDGIKYELVQRDIKINHVAVVNKARAGSMARIFDNKPEIKLMKVTLDNGRAVEVEDAIGAQVEDCISRLTKDADESKENSAKAEAKADALEEENKKLKEKSTDKAISDQVALVTYAMDEARKLAGKDFTCDSMDIIKIQKAALTVYNKDKDYSEKEDAYISVAFDMAMEKKVEEDEDEKEAKKKATDSHANLAKDMSVDTKDKISPRQAFADSLTGAWENTLEGVKA